MRQRIVRDDRIMAILRTAEYPLNTSQVPNCQFTAVQRKLAFPLQPECFLHYYFIVLQKEIFPDNFLEISCAFPVYAVGGRVRLKSVKRTQQLNNSTTAH